MDKKTYPAPEIKYLILSVEKIVCTSSTTYETTLEDWEEEEID